MYRVKESNLKQFPSLKDKLLSFLKSKTSSFNFHNKSFCVVKDSKTHPKSSEMIHTGNWNGIKQCITELEMLNAKSILNYLILRVQLPHDFFDQSVHISLLKTSLQITFKIAGFFFFQLFHFSADHLCL